MGSNAVSTNGVPFIFTAFFLNRCIECAHSIGRVDPGILLSIRAAVLKCAQVSYLSFQFALNLRIDASKT